MTNETDMSFGQTKGNRGTHTGGRAESLPDLPRPLKGKESHVPGDSPHWPIKGRQDQKPCQHAVEEGTQLAQS